MKERERGEGVSVKIAVREEREGPKKAPLN